MAEQRKNSVYSDDQKHIPMTVTRYDKKGKGWVKRSEEKKLISRNQAKVVLDKRGLPFERSHRLEKRDRFGHSEKYDTFTSIRGDGEAKTVWSIDFEQGNKNYQKLRKKSYADRQRYKKNKEARKRK